MQPANQSCKLSSIIIAVVLGILFGSDAAKAVTTIFFDSSQTTNLVAAGTTSDTISSEGYLFTLTRDKLFTGGVGLTNPIGRSIRVPWPDGLEAQAVTTGPALSGAKLVIKRQDGQPFAFASFTAKLLANTGGAGAAFEIMPLLNGEDGFPDPLMVDATGYYGQQFTYPTPTLTGFDTYQITLYVDFALLALTVVDASLPPPVMAVSPVGSGWMEIAWPTNAVGYTLESTANLPATLWNPVTNSVVISGDLFTVQLETTGSQQMYRLRKRMPLASGRSRPKP